ncbi:hypothetical protein HanRHA438_Chr10g0462151 [Helianthus annuus]|nr:hypothetical protein HanIR_Chr10g0484731 [Helianthus annuus]KAJ0880352.1 hypothetical protein HanRHA438_Chr10g0462151 [Helianthus annuus]
MVGLCLYVIKFTNLNISMLHIKKQLQHSTTKPRLLESYFPRIRHKLITLSFDHSK